MNDDLVKFAAEKLRKTVVYWDGMWCETNGAPLDHEDCMLKDFTLSSPDLFIKGLGVCPYSLSIHVNKRFTETNNFIEMASQEKKVVHPFLSKTELSEDFWACWYKLEKGGA